MNLLLVNSLYDEVVVGGAEVSVRILAETLAKDFCKVVVLSLTPGDDRVEEKNGVKVHYLRLRNQYWPHSNAHRTFMEKARWHIREQSSYWAEDLAKEIIKNDRIDLVHTNNLSGFSLGIWSSAKKLGIPVVHTLRDYSLIHPNATLFKRGKRILKPNPLIRYITGRKRRASATVSGVVGISKFILEKHLSLGYFKGVPIQAVVHNPIAKTIDRPSRGEGTRNEVFRFGYIGRISSEKGIPEMIRVLKALPLKWELLIGGDYRNKLGKELKESTLNLPITWLGWTESNSFFESIDCLLVPSMWDEPFGRVVIEAFSYGIPVVVNRVGGLPELVRDSVTGYVLDFSKPGSAAQSIGEHISSLRSLKNSSVLEAESLNFSSEKICKSYKGIYSQILER